MRTEWEGQILWEPSEQRKRSSNLAHYERWLGERVGRGFADYNDLWQWSVDNLEEFWKSIWDYCGVKASTPYKQVLVDRGMPGARWFDGAELNYAEHALRHDSDRPALIAVGERGDRTDISWGELRHQVATVASTLRRLGVGKGDRVVGYLPNIPQAAVAFLACATLGAVWSTCSPDFGTRSVVDRFRQIRPKVLFGADGYRYGGKPYDRTHVLSELRAALPSVEHTVFVPYLDPHASAPAGTIPWERCVDPEGSPTPEFEQVPFDHPLWVLYSSGTTGMPKGIAHGHGGIVVDLLASLVLHFDLRERDTFLWFTTTGWVMWNILLSTLMAGCTAGLTVRENVRLAALGADSQGGQRKATERVLEMFPGLERHLDLDASRLSAGQQQMVAIGRALVCGSRLLLVDEPTQGLAPNIAADIARTLRAAADRGLGVLLVEQNSALAIELADRAYAIDRGRIVAEGSAADLRERPDVVERHLRL